MLVTVLRQVCKLLLSVAKCLLQDLKKHRMNNHIVLSLEPSDANGRNSEGAFVTLSDGRILFAYTKFNTDGWDDNDSSIIACRVSSDNGHTWSAEDRVLVELGEAKNVMSVSLLRLQNNRIILHYLRKKETRDGVSCTPWLRYSDDEMETLSEPIPLITEYEYHCVNNDRIIQLQNGRLVVPVAQHRMGQSNFTDPGLIFFLLSDDNGQSWYESKSSYYRCFPSGHGWQEPGVVEMADGRLWAWMRTQWRVEGENMPRQWQTFSEDKGLTWSEPTPSLFVSPVSPLSMKRIPGSDDLLAVWNDRSGRFPFEERIDYEDRRPMACAISSDNGATWKNHRLLENDNDLGYCYTAIHFTGDAVLLAYCAGGPAPQISLQRLRMTRIPLQELLA